MPRIGLAVLAASAVAAQARADDRAVQAADEAAGLFVQACVPFAGDRAGLRQWILDHNLPPLPPGGQAAFLHGQPGVAYDATSPGGKFVLIAGEGGACSVVTPRADPEALAASVQRDLRALGLTVEAGNAREDETQAGLRWTDYTASKDARRWSLTVGSGGGLAMLTARPR